MTDPRGRCRGVDAIVRNPHTVNRGRVAIHRGLTFGLLLCSLLLPRSLPAVTQQSALELIRARNVAVEKILTSSPDEPNAETREKLKDIINGLMDFRELSRRALGKYWERITEQEKTDFVNVFRKLIRNSSVKKLSIYKADRVTYEESGKGDNGTVVSTIAYKGRGEVAIDYRMHKVGDDWKVYDMLIDGASTARTYRDSFYKEIERTSYGDMYDKLVRKLEEQS